MNHAMYLRRKRKVLAPFSKYEQRPEVILCLMDDIRQLGHTLSPALQERLGSYSNEEIEEFNNRLIQSLKELLGAHVRYTPMYPNFPRQVVELSKLELLLNAHMHYLGDWLGIRITPNYVTLERPTLQEEYKLRAIEVGTEEEFHSMSTQILRSRIAFSPTDAADLAWFVKHHGDAFLPFIPSEVPSRENAAILMGLLMRHTSLAGQLAPRLVTTATDVLRVAAALSGGDVSLAKPCKFQKITKQERRLLLSCLDRCGGAMDDVLRRPEQWKRLGECLHPGEYRSRWPKAFAAFETVRGPRTHRTWNAQVEMAIARKDMPAALALLRTRPGELARKMDLLLRTSEDTAAVLEAFSRVAAKVSTPVLLQVMAHFRHRMSPLPIRVIFPKGDLAKLKAIPNRLPALTAAQCEAAVLSCEQALVAHYAQRKPLGKVYLSEGLRHFTVPFALRSASKSLRTIARGSRIPLHEGDTVRMFIWWHDGSSRTDIDLSAVGLDKDHKVLSTIAYYNLRELGGAHSGDITSAPNGAAEFIDVNIPSFLKAKIRYLMMVVNSFTQQPYCDLPECFAGLMMRQKPDSGEIFEPRTVQDRFDLTANSRVAVPLILDLQTREAIWTDMSMTNLPGRANNVFNNRSRLSILNESMVSLRKPSLHELISLHIRARGTQVLDKRQADVIFDLQEGIEPTHIDILISEYL